MYSTLIEVCKLTLLPPYKAEEYIHVYLPVSENAQEGIM